MESIDLVSKECCNNVLHHYLLFTSVYPTIDPCAPEEDDTNLSSVSLDNSQVMSRASSRKSVGYDSMNVHILWLHISHAPILRSHRRRSLDLTTARFMFPTVNWLHGLQYPPAPPLRARRIAASWLPAFRIRTFPQHRLATSCTSLLRFQVIISSVQALRSQFIPVPACPIVLRVCSTTPCTSHVQPEYSGTTDQPVHPSSTRKNENLTGCFADRPPSHLLSTNPAPRARLVHTATMR